MILQFALLPVDMSCLCLVICCKHLLLHVNALTDTTGYPGLVRLLSEARKPKDNVVIFNLLYGSGLCSQLSITH